MIKSNLCFAYKVFHPKSKFLTTMAQCIVPIGATTCIIMKHHLKLHPFPLKLKFKKKEDCPYSKYDTDLDMG